MFRKSILILLIAVMILTSACGKDKSQDEAKEKSRCQREARYMDC